MWSTQETTEFNVTRWLKQLRTRHRRIFNNCSTVEQLSPAVRALRSSFLQRSRAPIRIALAPGYESHRFSTGIRLATVVLRQLRTTALRFTVLFLSPPPPCGRYCKSAVADLRRLSQILVPVSRGAVADPPGRTSRVSRRLDLKPSCRNSFHNGSYRRS